MNNYPREVNVHPVQQAGPDFVLRRSSEINQSKPESGLTRSVGAYNDKLFLAEHRMEKGWIGAAHSHPHDQVVYVISGHLNVRCAGQEFDARPGDSFVVRGGVEHQASAIEASHVIDVFTPCRHDYL
jgi:quercetin dioxygenase-like cupin family protein